MFYNKKDIRFFGSQGEHKIALVLIKLAEYQIIRNATQLTPTILLDDLFATLDFERSDAVLSLLEKNTQTIITNTDLVDIKNHGIKNDGKKICGYAATAKSSTILNYCKIGTDLIDYITDTTKEKIGKFSPGMHIPIISAENFTIDKPDVSYLFAWNHKKEIFKKEKSFLSQGGTWISHVNI